MKILRININKKAPIVIKEKMNCPYDLQSWTTVNLLDIRPSVLRQ